MASSATQQMHKHKLIKTITNCG